MEKSNELCDEIKGAFSRLRSVLASREKELLRQVDVLSQRKLKGTFRGAKELEEVIASFGRIDLDNLPLFLNGGDNDTLYHAEDYQRPENDHISLYKFLQTTNTSDGVKVVNVTLTKDRINLLNILNQQEIAAKQQLDKKIIKENLNESACKSSICKQPLPCVTRRDPTLCTHFAQLDRFDKYQITKEDEATKDSTDLLERSAPIPETTRISPPSTDLISPTIITKDRRNSEPKVNSHCDCYDNPMKKSETVGETIGGEKMRKLSLEHPIQVQQWMSQIMSEPETEPMQSNDMLEHSNIYAN